MTRVKKTLDGPAVDRAAALAALDRITARRETAGGPHLDLLPDDLVQIVDFVHQHPLAAAAQYHADVVDALLIRDHLDADRDRQLDALLTAVRRPRPRGLGLSLRQVGAMLGGYHSRQAVEAALARIASAARGGPRQEAPARARRTEERLVGRAATAPVLTAADAALLTTVRDRLLQHRRDLPDDVDYDLSNLAGRPLNRSLADRLRVVLQELHDDHAGWPLPPGLAEQLETDRAALRAAGRRGL